MPSSWETQGTASASLRPVGPMGLQPEDSVAAPGLGALADPLAQGRCGLPGTKVAPVRNWHGGEGIQAARAGTPVGCLTVPPSGHISADALSGRRAPGSVLGALPTQPQPCEVRQHEVFISIPISPVRKLGLTGIELSARARRVFTQRTVKQGRPPGVREQS